jgi:hypothetical protein
MPNKTTKVLLSWTTSVLLAMLLGCAQGERSFLIVQVCLDDRQDLSAFRNLIESVAIAEHMQFTDRSDETQRELRSINNPDVPQASPVINFGIIGEDGIGLTAGNMGMPPNEIAVGFTGASDLPRAHQFANSVVAKLQEQWHVESVPAGTAAQGMRNCAH